MLNVKMNLISDIKTPTMDAALLAEREAFKRRAMAVPTIENKKRKVEEPPKKSSGPSKPSSATEKTNINRMKNTMGSTSQFGVLARIVRHMKARHMDSLLKEI